MLHPHLVLHLRLMLCLSSFFSEGRHRHR